MAICHFYYMARRPNIDFKGAVYQVITCGDQRRKVFKRENDTVKIVKIEAVLFSEIRECNK
jgi:hypothetical protein